MSRLGPATNATPAPIRPNCSATSAGGPASAWTKAWPGRSPGNGDWSAARLEAIEQEATEGTESQAATDETRRQHGDHSRCRSLRVCLFCETTKQTRIARKLGYSCHSCD